VGPTIADVGFEYSSEHFCHVYTEKPKLIVFLSLVATAIDMHSKTPDFMTAYPVVTYLHYRSSGLGDFQQTRNTAAFLAAVQQTVLRVKINT
jgi:hypothetical protein